MLGSGLRRERLRTPQCALQGESRGFKSLNAHNVIGIALLAIEKGREARRDAHDSDLAQEQQVLL